MSHSQFRTSRMIFIAGAVLLAFVLGGDAGTHGAPLKKGKLVEEAQILSDQQLSLAIVTLHSVKLTLEAADHDYGGHRAAAAGHVAGAEFEVRRALGHRQPGAGPAKFPSVKESQVYSNAQLALAVPVLVDTAALLTNADHDYGGHRAKAIAKIEAAIAELEAALEFIWARRKRIKRLHVLEIVEVVEVEPRRRHHPTTVFLHKKIVASNKKVPNGRVTLSRPGVAKKGTEKITRTVKTKTTKPHVKQNSAQHKINTVAKAHSKSTKSMTRAPRPALHMHVHMSVRRR